MVLLEQPDLMTYTLSLRRVAVELMMVSTTSSGSSITGVYSTSANTNLQPVSLVFEPPPQLYTGALLVWLNCTLPEVIMT